LLQAVFIVNLCFIIYIGAGKDISDGKKILALVAARAIRKMSTMVAGKTFWRKNCMVLVKSET
jgi:hypothetical protein